jgi:nucleotide-binding universal stress UspA family protein
MALAAVARHAGTTRQTTAIAESEGAMTTILVGVDRSPGARAAVRVAAALAETLGARLIAVHVLDRLADFSLTAERVAAGVLYDEAPDARAEARGEVGDVAERLASIARDEEATMIVLGARSRGRSRTYLRARCAAELAELTTVPIVVAPAQLAASIETSARTAPTPGEGVR